MKLIITSPAMNVCVLKFWLNSELYWHWPWHRPALALKAKSLALALRVVASTPSLSIYLSASVCAQVFDSPVDFDGVPRGVARALTDFRPVQLAIKSSLDVYMTVFHRSVTKHYRQASQTFRQNPLRTPSLVLYSRSDVVATPGPIESLIERWRSDGVPVLCHRWADTRHVQHYLRDPVNYIRQLQQFMITCGLVNDDEYRRLRVKEW